MPTINVNDAYVLNETGAQVDAVTDIPFKQDAGLTDAQKAQARANLGISESGGVNRNLLDNAWFTVNQRGWTSGNMGSMQYWADRWHMNTDTSNPSTLSLNNGVVTITTPSGTNRFGNILQTLADPDAIVGKVVTLSVLKSDDTIISGTITRTAATTQDAYNEGGIILRLSSTNRFNVQVEAGKTLSIKAAKLELGSTSTLAQDVPPDYGEELAKCQRYFYRVSLNTQTDPFAVGIAYSGDLRFLLPIGKMRATPTVATTSVSAIAIRGEGVSGATVTGLTVITQNELGVYLKAATSTSLTSYQLYAMTMTSNSAIIDLSADL